MSIEAVMGTVWFQKSLEISEFQSSVFELDRFLEKEAKSSNAITAFDLISLSSGLDLSGLFERRKRKEKRFTARVSAERVVEKAGMIGEKLGFRVEKKEETKVVGLGKGRTAVVVEVVEFAEGLVVADVKVVVEGEEEEEEVESHWSELIVELEEIVLSWHN